MVQRIELELCPPENGSGEPSRLGIPEFLRTLLRHKFKASLVFFAVMALAVLGTALATRTYRSEAKLLVRLGRENGAIDPTATLGQGSMIVGPTPREYEINSVAEIVHSRRIIESVVDAVGPAAILLASAPPVATSDAGRHEAATPSAPADQVQTGSLGQIAHSWGLSSLLSDRDKAIVKLLKGLRVEPIAKSSIVEVSYDGYRPETAQAIVAKVIDCYLDQHVRLNRTPGAHEFLAQQTERLRSSLARSEADLHDLMNEKGIISSEGQREALVRHWSQLEMSLREAMAAAAASEAQVGELSTALTHLPMVQVADETSGVGDYGTDVMRGQLYGLQLKEHELLAKYTDQYPELRQIREQVAAAQATLDHESRTRSQVSKHPDQTYKESEIALLREKAILASWRGKIATLRKQLSEVRTEMKGFNDTDVRLRTLRRETELQETQYRKYAENLDQARIDQALDVQRMSNISVAQPATYEAPAVSPRPLQSLALGLAIGLFGAIATAFSAEHWGGTRAPTGDRRRPTKIDGEIAAIVAKSVAAKAKEYAEVM